MWSRHGKYRGCFPKVFSPLAWPSQIDYLPCIFLIRKLFLIPEQETKDEDLEKLVQAHCRLDLTSPMPGCSGNHQRNLHFEGDLKLKEGTSSKVDYNLTISRVKEDFQSWIRDSRMYPFGSRSRTFQHANMTDLTVNWPDFSLSREV